jgi:hypothetical protein
MTQGPPPSAHQQNDAQVRRQLKIDSLDQNRFRSTLLNVKYFEFI